jgi:hypothetical protein
MLSFEYLAGLFDGEGCVQVTNTPAVRAKLTSTHKPLIDLLEAQFGGNVSSNRAHKKDDWKEAWTWTVYGQIALNFLAGVKPFLVVKAEAANLALQFKMSKSGVHLSEDARLERIRLHEELHRVNRRGVTKPPATKSLLKEINELPNW